MARDFLPLDYGKVHGPAALIVALKEHTEVIMDLDMIPLSSIMPTILEAIADKLLDINEV